MKTIKIKSVIIGSVPNDKIICDWLQSFNLGYCEITNNKIIVRKGDKELISEIRKIEEDTFSETFLGKYPDGTAFRLIRPAGVAKQIFDQRGEPESITFGGLTGDRYAVYFDLI
jgi:hypothetical protein